MRTKRPNREMEYSHGIKNNILHLRFAGDLNELEGGNALYELARLSMEDGVRECILDLSGLRYVNSTGIGMLITLLAKFRNKGGEVYLLKVPENIGRLLAITKLNSIFQVIQSENEVGNRV